MSDSPFNAMWNLTVTRTLLMPAAVIFIAAVVVGIIFLIVVGDQFR